MRSDEPRSPRLIVSVQYLRSHGLIGPHEQTDGREDRRRSSSKLWLPLLNRRWLLGAFCSFGGRAAHAPEFGARPERRTITSAPFLLSLSSPPASFEVCLFNHGSDVVREAYQGEHPLTGADEGGKSAMARSRRVLLPPLESADR